MNYLKESPQLSQKGEILNHFRHNLFLQSLVVSLVLLLEFLEHLVFNLGQSNGDVHLTTSLRLFWNHS